MAKTPEQPRGKTAAKRTRKTAAKGTSKAKSTAKKTAAKADASKARAQTTRPRAARTAKAKPDAFDAHTGYEAPEAPQTHEETHDADARHSAARETGSGPKRRATGRARRAPLMGDGEDYLDFLTRMFDEVGQGEWDPDRFDDMTQNFGLVLGSGPAFAALESMLSNVSAQSAVLMNAVQTQRQLDQVGLCCTSACVKQLMNLNSGSDGD